MIIGLKDIVKLLGISVVSFCAVFVCTLFMNFYIDVGNIEQFVTEQTKALYDAQVSMAGFVCVISGGCLSIIAFVMLIFYIKLYVDEHRKELGILKAMGYYPCEIAGRFSVFGISIFCGCFIGCLCAYVFMPLVYDGMHIQGLPNIDIVFHLHVPICLVIVPTIVFGVFAYFISYVALRKPVGELISNAGNNKTYKYNAIGVKMGFLGEMFMKTATGKKMLAFFVAFASFCFSSMVQMAFSMKALTDAATMYGMILGIGLVLAGTTILMSMKILTRSNARSVAIMKSFGYTTAECAYAVFGGFVPFFLIGFAVGTAYQFGLLSFMVNSVFSDVGNIVNYTFNVTVFLWTFIAFVFIVIALFISEMFAIGKMPLRQSAE